MVSRRLHLLQVVAISLLWLSSVAAFPLFPMTVTVPDGTTNHGDDRIICPPTKWTDLALFYIINYVAHAATTRSLPGERNYSIVLASIGALFLPGVGVMRGIMAIMSLAKFGRSSLKVAARAGALCMVVRAKDWKPVRGRMIPHVLVQRPRLTDPDIIERYPRKKGVWVAVYKFPWIGNVLNHFELQDRYIHGSYSLPDGYELRGVPKDASFEGDGDDKFFFQKGTNQKRISCNYSVVKILVAMGQALYAVLTLYKTRGDQIQEYGYAAFGLTVAPYAVISIVNLLGALLCPEYPAIYLVSSSVMDEARMQDNAFFDGVVGRLLEDEEPLLETSDPDLRLLGSRCRFRYSSRKDLIVHLQLSKRDDPRSSEAECELTLHESNSKIPLTKGALESRIYQVHGVMRSWDCYKHNHPNDRVVLVPSCHPYLAARMWKDQQKPRYYFSQEGPYFENWVNITSGDVRQKSSRTNLAAYIAFVVNATPLIIVGVMSHFQEGRISSQAQRAWFMTWLCIGSFFGPFVPLLLKGYFMKERQLKSRVMAATTVLLNLFLYGIAATGGLIIVGRMLWDYGACVRMY